MAHLPPLQHHLLHFTVSKVAGAVEYLKIISLEFLDDMTGSTQPLLTINAEDNPNDTVCAYFLDLILCEAQSIASDRRFL